MSRTVFVNPSFENPRRKRRKKGRKSRGRRSYKGRRRGRKAVYRGTMVLRRNAGITPFVQNPLILSNPRRRRARRKNPLSMPSAKNIFENVLSTGGGAIAALTVNTVGLSRIDNKWLRRGSQLGTAAIGGALISQKSSAMGAAFAGAAFVPLLQDLAADLLGIGVAAGVSSKEADLDALAADLEDVLEEMGDDEDELGDDDDMYAW